MLSEETGPSHEEGLLNIDQHTAFENEFNHDQILGTTLRSLESAPDGIASSRNAPKKDSLIRNSAVVVTPSGALINEQKIHARDSILSGGLGASNKNGDTFMPAERLQRDQSLMENKKVVDVPISSHSQKVPILTGTELKEDLQHLNAGAQAPTQHGILNGRSFYTPLYFTGHEENEPSSEMEMKSAIEAIRNGGSSESNNVAKQPLEEASVYQELKNSKSGSQVYGTFYINGTPQKLILDTGSNYLWLGKKKGKVCPKFTAGSEGNREITVTFGTGKLSGPVGTTCICLSQTQFQNQDGLSDEKKCFFTDNCVFMKCVEINEAHGKQFGDPDFQGILGLAMPEMEQIGRGFFHLVSRANQQQVAEITFVLQKNNPSYAFWGHYPRKVLADENDRIRYYRVDKPYYWTLRLVKFYIGCCCFQMHDGLPCFDSDINDPDDFEKLKDNNFEKLKDRCFKSECLDNTTDILTHQPTQNITDLLGEKIPDQYIIVDTGTTFFAVPEALHTLLKNLGMFEPIDSCEKPIIGRYNFPRISYELMVHNTGEPISSQMIQLKPSDYLVKGIDNKCKLAFMRVDTPDKQGIFGQMFMRSHATSFQLDCSQQKDDKKSSDECVGFVGFARSKTIKVACDSANDTNCWPEIIKDYEHNLQELEAQEKLNKKVDFHGHQILTRHVLRNITHYDTDYKFRNNPTTKETNSTEQVKNIPTHDQRTKAPIEEEIKVAVAEPVHKKLKQQ